MPIVIGNNTVITTNSLYNPKSFMNCPNLKSIRFGEEEDA
jgi:hypothetical protein